MANAAMLDFDFYFVRPQLPCVEGEKSEFLFRGMNCPATNDSYDNFPTLNYSFNWL